MREPAECLQLRHHSVLELVDRTQAHGLVDRAAHPVDARAVRILLTHDGDQILSRFSSLHRDGLRRMNATLRLPTWHDDPASVRRAPFSSRRGRPVRLSGERPPINTSVIGVNWG